MVKLKDLVPPVLYNKLRESPLRRHGWFGNYKTWQTAEEQSVGYDDNLIIDKVLKSTLKVKNGEFPYERDSVLFEEIQYDWPLLAGLMWVASRTGGNLNVLDFGGSLGSTYWQNRKYLDTLENLSWTIIEQPKYVDAGRKHLNVHPLKFFPTLEAGLQDSTPNLILFSSVLNYIEEPFKLLEKLFDLQVEHIILERLLFIPGNKDRITVQKVPPKIYSASYPCWFFSESNFLNFAQQRYKIHETYDCGIKLNVPSSVKGLILTLKK